MLLLVTDTSGKNGYVAIVRAGDAHSDKIEVIESIPLAGGTFSAQLVPQIAGLLAKHGLLKNDVDGFVVVAGPGSFTGLRVGLAAIKALAEILGKPIVPVSLLEAVALSCGKDGRILAALDAGRGEIYAGEYEVAGGVAQLIREQLATKDNLASNGSGALVTADENVSAVARIAGMNVSLVDRPCAESIARLGWRKLQAGETVSPEQLDANYIRRSDAEIFAKPAV